MPIFSLLENTSNKDQRLFHTTPTFHVMLDCDPIYQKTLSLLRPNWVHISPTESFITMENIHRRKTLFQLSSKRGLKIRYCLEKLFNVYILSSNPYCEILTENINFFTKPGTQEMSFNGTDIIFFYSDPVHEVQNRGETPLA